MATKATRLKVRKNSYGQLLLTHNGVDVHACSLKKNGKTYEAQVKYADVQGLEIGGDEIDGIRLTQDKNGALWVHVDGLKVVHDTDGRGDPIVYVDNKTCFTLTDNRSQVFSGWYANTHSRESAFKKAMWYLELRVISGIPTKKPYILHIQEDSKRPGEPKRQWDIKLEIVRKK